MSTHRSIGGLFGSGRERPYECRTCGATFEVEYYVCPECEGFSVERRDVASSVGNLG